VSILQDVEACLSIVGILGRVPDSMIVVPECPGSLCVGIVVILVLPRFGSVLSPAIKWCTACRRCVSISRISMSDQTLRRTV